MAIVLILAALVTSGVARVSERNKENRAKIQVALLSNALEQYKQDMGHYPLTADAADPGGANADLLYQALFHEGYEYLGMASPPADWNKAKRIYVADLDPVTGKQGWLQRPADGRVPDSIDSLRDPWGNEYRYRSNAAIGGSGSNSNTVNADFDLWSVGKDSRTRGDLSIPAHPDNLDDVRNFLPRLGIASASGGW